MDFKPVVDLCDKISIIYEFRAKTAPLSSFRVGGEAKLVVYPDCINSFCQILDTIVENNFKFIVIGNGTNVYFNDYYDGIIIVTKNLSAINKEHNTITALCGTDLNKLSNFALDNSLTGLEFTFGIPGTVGGALYMNASAFGSSISSYTYQSLVFDIVERKIKNISKEEHRFGLKTSIFSKEKRYIVLKSSFNLEFSEPKIIKEKMLSYMSKRISAQPLNLPSAGSVFIKPKDFFASKLIDDAGLKGTKIGGIEVSKKHAGFFVNTENGTAKDVNNLILYVKSVIKEKYNIDLHEEIIFVE